MRRFFSEYAALYRRESHITARIIYSDIYKRFFLPQCALSTYIYSIFFFQKTLRMLDGITETIIYDYAITCI